MEKEQKAPVPADEPLPETAADMPSGVRAAVRQLLRWVARAPVG